MNKILWNSCPISLTLQLQLRSAQASRPAKGRPARSPCLTKTFTIPVGHTDSADLFDKIGIDQFDTKEVCFNRKNELDLMKNKLRPVWDESTISRRRNCWKQKNQNIFRCFCQIAWKIKRQGASVVFLPLAGKDRESSLKGKDEYGWPPCTN